MSDMQLKVGDIIRFRFKGSNAHNDWSPPALITEHFQTIEANAQNWRLGTEPFPNIWVVLCDGMRCMANEDVHEIEVISPVDFFPPKESEDESG